MSSPAENGSKSGRNSQKSSATLQSTKSNKSTKSDTSNAPPACKALTPTTTSRSTSTPPYASTSHNAPSVQLTTYLADPTHSNPSYAHTHTDAFAHIYGFPHDPMLRLDLEDEMKLEAMARVQEELDEYDRATRKAETKEE